MRLPNRVLFTGDSNYLFATPSIYRPGSGPFTVKHVLDHIRLLAESGVDTYLLNPNAQRAFYPSKVIPRMTDGYRRGDHAFVRCFALSSMPSGVSEEEVYRYEERLIAWMNPMLDLEEAGVDWLAEAILACRQYGVAPWVSIRMNDVHGSNNPSCLFINCPLYEDARYRLRGERPEIPGETWSYFSGLNYECAEVRDYMFAQILEVVEDYEFEGLELDWLRNPLCCEPGASQATIDMMTEWVGEIRALTHARGEQTGRRYPLGIRTPGDLGTMRAIGLDITAMVQQGLIDYVSPSNFWQTTWDMPHNRLRAELGEEVTIYGVIEDAPNWLPCARDGGQRGTLHHWTQTLNRLLSASAPLMRGNAAGKLALGADGIEFFNFFATDQDLWEEEAATSPADYAAIRRIDQLDFLRGQPKGYTFSTPFGACYFAYWEQTEQLPAILEPLWRRAFSLPMCSEPADSGLELIIQLVVEEQDHLPPLGVSFNGCWPSFQSKATSDLLFPVITCSHHVSTHRAFNYRFTVEAIKEGWNEITVYNGCPHRADREQRRENSVVIVSIELAVV